MKVNVTVKLLGVLVVAQGFSSMAMQNGINITALQSDAAQLTQYGKQLVQSLKTQFPVVEGFVTRLQGGNLNKIEQYLKSNADNLDFAPIFKQLSQLVTVVGQLEQHAISQVIKKFPALQKLSIPSISDAQSALGALQTYANLSQLRKDLMVGFTQLKKSGELRGLGNQLQGYLPDLKEAVTAIQAINFATIEDAAKQLVNLAQGKDYDITKLLPGVNAAKKILPQLISLGKNGIGMALAINESFKSVEATVLLNPLVKTTLEQGLEVLTTFSDTLAAIKAKIASYIN